MKFLLLFLSFFICFSHHAADLTPKQIEACALIKQIPPYSTGEKSPAYDQVMQKMQNNNVSICSCVKHFMKVREQKAQNAINTEWKVNPKVWPKIDKDAEALNRLDEKYAKVTFDPAIDKNDQEKIKKIIESKNIKAPINIKYVKPGKSSCATRNISSIQTWGFEHSAIIKLQDFKHATDPEVRDYLIADHLSHEISHIIMDLAKTIGIKNSIALGNKNFYKSSSYLKYKRFEEAQADRVLPACGCVEDAKAHFYGRWQNELNTSDEDYMKKDVHPSAYKRLLWAQRILNLKFEEENLKKLEAQKN
jgi:hypothetical protein